MKKLFVGIAAGVLAAAMCVSFAACGSSVDAKGIKGEEVTEEEWNAAIDAVLADDAELTIEYLSKNSNKSELTMNAGGSTEKLNAKSKMEQRMTYIQKGAKQSGKGYYEISYSGDLEGMAEAMGQQAGVQEGKTELEAYSEVTTDGTHYYAKDEEGEWTLDEDGDTVIEELFDEYYMLKYNVKNHYNDYTFSEEHKGYIPANYDAEDGDTLYVVKFQNKKLTGVYIESNYTREQDMLEDVMPGTMIMKVEVEASINIVISYEAKDITLPTVAE